MPQPQPQPSKMQAVVEYLPNITIVGATPALLEWTADDRVRLFKMNFDTMQATEVLFDVPYGQVEKVVGSTVMLTITVAGKKYRAQFSQTGMAKLAVGGVVGLAASAHDANTSGIGRWVELFRSAGVKTQYLGFAWAFKIAGLIVGAMILLITAFILL